MSFLKNLKEKAKDITGLGLDANEQYARAYEKGVLLQKYLEAAKHFTAAAEKFESQANITMALRARANAALYKLIGGESFEHVPPLLSALDGVEEIEHIGSQHEMVAVAPLLTELRALNQEHMADTATEAPAKIAGHQEAAKLFMSLGSANLQLSEYLPIRGPAEKCSARALYNTGLADYHSAFSAVNASPEEAHNLLQRALSSFRSAGAQELAEKTAGYVDDIKSRRHCWICGREMQGRGLFYRYYPSDVGAYHRGLVESLEQDSGMLDQENRITICTACGSAIEYQADEYATMRSQEVREWAEGEFAVHSERINDLVEAANNLLTRVQSLERAAHTHSS